jgi:hypothetical protein
MSATALRNGSPNSLRSERGGGSGCGIKAGKIFCFICLLKQPRLFRAFRKDFLLEELEVILAAFLGFVHGDVGAFYQAFYRPPSRG